MSDWKLFRGTPTDPHAEAKRLETLAPPWRQPGKDRTHRATTYIASEPEKLAVNAALHLRRPLLVTGPPGCGKSSLAYAIAEEMQLGPVLKWPINSRTTLADGLYHYDAIGRMRDVQHDPVKSKDIASYLQLMSLGTALASPTVRVVLIDEIDKADIDLPNDLLHVLEEGNFEIRELQRLAETQSEIHVRNADGSTVTVKNGSVPATVFPIIVLTSNGERELPLALHRRCLRLKVEPPTEERLAEIVQSHLGAYLQQDDPAAKELKNLITDFVTRRNGGKIMATDQLLNFLYLLFQDRGSSLGKDADAVRELIFRGLDE